MQLELGGKRVMSQPIKLHADGTDRDWMENHTSPRLYTLAELARLYKIRKDTLYKRYTKGMRGKALITKASHKGKHAR